MYKLQQRYHVIVETPRTFIETHWFGRKAMRKSLEAWQGRTDARITVTDLMLNRKVVVHMK